jgi:hypothetical protein
MTDEGTDTVCYPDATPGCTPPTAPSNAWTCMGVCATGKSLCQQGVPQPCSGFTLPNPADPNALINDALNILYRVPLSDTLKATIKTQILLSGQVQDYYWSNAWNAYLSSPTDMTAFTTVNSRLTTLYKYLMNLAEYQLA